MSQDAAAWLDEIRTSQRMSFKAIYAAAVTREETKITAAPSEDEGGEGWGPTALDHVDPVAAGAGKQVRCVDCGVRGGRCFIPF